MKETVTLAGGCFWCIEAIFNEIRGVNSVVPGYTGGKTANPTYEQLHSQDTGHAEAIKIRFDPEIIAYKDLLKVFYSVHDPTTLNRQGNDVGSQYRSAIFYENDTQKQQAIDVTSDFAAKVWDPPVVTEITRLVKFWPAEEYHRDYFKNNPEQAYCQLIINPKLKKFRSKFSELLK